MKKESRRQFLVFVLCFALLMALTGCGGSAKDEKPVAGEKKNH